MCPEFRSTAVSSFSGVERDNKKATRIYLVTFLSPHNFLFYCNDTRPLEIFSKCLGSVQTAKGKSSLEASGRTRFLIILENHPGFSRYNRRTKGTLCTPTVYLWECCRSYRFIDWHSIKIDGQCRAPTFSPLRKEPMVSIE